MSNSLLRGARTGLGGVAAATAVLVTVGSARAQLAFTDIAAGVGVDLAVELNESVAWGDYDNDQDLYLTINGTNRLFRNDSHDAVTVFTDVTSATGVGDGGFSVGAAFGDLDNDGDVDLGDFNTFSVNFTG